MKKLCLLILAGCLAMLLQAQVSKTVHLATAGTLGTRLTAVELAAITNLTLTGKIDARDFKTMREKMPVLAHIDMETVKIEAYTEKRGQWYKADELPHSAFSNPYSDKASLKSINLPKSVTSIGSYAFSGCRGLTTISIPNSVISFGDNAFDNCTGLTTVIIPSSVTTIRVDVFSGCSSLTSISVDGANTAYSSIDGVLYNKYNVLLCYPAGKTGRFMIPSSVTSIGTDAFRDCIGLTSISIPHSVTSIGYNAFSGCNGLTTIRIPRSVTAIAKGAFYGCSGLTAIRIPRSVTSIEMAAFAGCRSLTVIKIPNSVTSIEGGAFAGCSGLTTISIPRSVTSIGEDAFDGCSGLTAIRIPYSVTSIGDFAFANCTGLSSISIDEANTEYSSIDGVLYNKSNTTLLCFPAGKTGSFTIPNMVTSIENLAFSHCSGLTAIIIPHSVTSIGRNAFWDCRNLSSIAIPNSVTSIEDLAFDSCTGLSSIKVYWTVPIDLRKAASAFEAIPATATLYVPAGSKAAYAAADVWKKFANIVEF